MSDHFPIALTLGHKYTHYRSQKHKLIHYRSFAKFNENDFLNDLTTVNLYIVETIADPNLSLEVLYSMLNHVLKNHAPFKIKKVKRAHQPGWYSEEIREARKIRDKYKLNKNWEQYKVWRNKCNSIVKNSKKTFFNNAVKDQKDPKYLWQGLKTVVNNDIDKKAIPNNLCFDNIHIEGKQNVADALNKHFVTISRLINKTPFHEENFKRLKDYADSKLQNTEFNIAFITTSDVDKFIDKLDSHKSTGSDGIGPNILKTCKEHLIVPLTSIINTCIYQGIFPDKLKIANVIPIHKGGSREDPNNYRPISILPTLSKIYEKHIANQLKSFFEKTNILHQHQSGFREKHSCQTALLRLVDSWLEDIDSGNYVGAVFLDFKKAFDLVDHDILIQKLKLYHFSTKTIKLFESYLSDRSQHVKIETLSSEDCKVLTGVPQGSILGPLLFLLYVNDLPLSLGSSTDMYADDTTVHASNKNISQVELSLQSDLHSVNEWCIHNNMAINPIKTKCMILCTKQKCVLNNTLCLSIDNSVIENVTCHKLLGIYIDHCLTWKPHIDKTCAKLTSKLYLLRRIQNYLTLEMKQMFYNAYITPIFDFGCITWQHAGKSSLKRLTRIQNRAARIIMHKSRRDNSAEIIKSLNWLSIPKRIDYFTGLMVFKSLNRLTPLYISQAFNVSKNSRYSLRSETNKQIAHCPYTPRTRFFQQTFKYTGMKIWNAIPLHIKTSASLKSFKVQYKCFLINNQDESLPHTTCTMQVM